MTDQPAVEGERSALVVPAGVVEGELIEDPPVGWVETEPDVMSNLDHRIDQDVAALLRQGGRYSRHAAWDFNGLVWWRNERWHEAVWVHHRYVGSYAADTLDELMKTVNNRHGWA